MQRYKHSGRQVDQETAQGLGVGCQLGLMDLRRQDDGGRCSSRPWGSVWWWAVLMEIVLQAFGDLTKAADFLLAFSAMGDTRNCRMIILIHYSPHQIG